jgi:hypothetical protein
MSISFVMGLLLVISLIAGCGQSDPVFAPSGSAVIHEYAQYIRVAVDGGRERTAVVSVDDTVVATLGNHESVRIPKADYPVGPHELVVVSTWSEGDRTQTQRGTFEGTGAPAKDTPSDDEPADAEPDDEPTTEEPTDDEPANDEDPSPSEPVDEQPADDETPSSAAGTCLEESSDVVDLSGTFRAYDNRDGFSAGTTVDASGSVFTRSDGNYTAFRLYNAEGVCIHGGLFDNLVDADSDWAFAKQHTGLAFRYSDNITVENVAIVRTGDGLSFGEGVSDWTVRSSYIQRAMDDTVENDYMEAGLVDDVLVDHTFAFISSRVGSSRRGDSYAGGTVTVQNSLVRLAPQNAADGGFRGGRLWKWEKYAEEPAKLVIRNNVFMFEPGEYSDTYLDPADDPDIDYDVILEAEGNVVVWLGEGPFPSRVPEGFTVVTDRGVWEDARSDWFDAHPQFAKYE